MTMLKGYISRWQDRGQVGQQTITDYWFNSKPENAAYWRTEEDAQNGLRVFEHGRIVISSNEGGTHICKGFKVEQRAPEEFVVYCEAPFIQESLTGKSISTDTQER